MFKSSCLVSPTFSLDFFAEVSITLENSFVYDDHCSCKSCLGGQGSAMRETVQHNLGTALKYLAREVWPRITTAAYSVPLKTIYLHHRVWS